MPNYKLRFILPILALSLPSISASEDITTQTLIASITQNHPKLLSLSAGEQQVVQGIQAAEGAFDIRVQQSTKLKTSGFYDGNYLSQSLVKPLRFMGGRVTSEYRISDGTFADYDGNYETRSGGEASVAIALSLMRDRDTDSRRVAVSNAKLSVQEFNSQQRLSINKLLYDGLSRYLDWYETNLRLLVIAELYKTTKFREQAIKSRIDKGLLAAITLTEFNSILLGRLTSFQDAQQRFIISQQGLSFYYRDQNGKMIDTEQLNQSPDDILWPFNLSEKKIEQIQQQLISHPSMKIFYALVEQAKNDYSLSENALLPQLDIEAKLARDIGSGDESLGVVDSEIGLTFSIPLGQQTAKAQKIIAQQKIQELGYELQLVSDLLQQDFEQSILRLNNAKQIAYNQRQQAQIANKLFSQEQKRFDLGVSDLFLLNARESSAIEAKLKAIGADITVFRQELATLFIAANLDLPNSS
jgi:outer membrane protein TolC